MLANMLPITLAIGSYTFCNVNKGLGTEQLLN